MNLYSKFYKQVGVRLPTNLKNPRTSFLKDIELPRNSYLHYTDQDYTGDLVLGIEGDSVFLSNLPKQSKVVMFHQVEYSDSVNLSDFSVVKRTLQKDMLIKQYHREHSGFIKGFIDRSKVNSQLNLVVKSHTLVGADFKYNQNVLMDFHKLNNYWKSVFDDVGKTVLSTNKNHFLPIKLPSVIPSRTQLNKWETGSKTANWRSLNSQDRYLFSEFYGWFKSGVSTVIPKDPKVLSRLNIIFYHKYFYYVVNMGLLQSWIIPESGKSDNNQRLTEDMARKLFLLGAVKLVMGANSMVTTTTSDNSKDEKENGDDESAIDYGDYDSRDYRDGDVDAGDIGHNSGFLDNSESDSINKLDKGAYGGKYINTVEELLNVGRAVAKDDSEKSIKRGGDDGIFNSEEEEELEDDSTLEMLEEMNEEVTRQEDKIEIQKVVGYSPYVSEGWDLTTAVETKVDRLAVEGNYTTAELKRLKAIGRKWESIKDPSGSDKPMADIIDIKPQDLTIDETVPLTKVKLNGVVEPSMQLSTLGDYNKRYLKELLPRHMAACALNAQKSGTCVTDYKVDRFQTAFDDYEMHSFKLIPLVGKESTVKFKVPIVEEDGSFKASGVMSKMRNQRIDLPIRKISHNQVALTSYVSKFLVERSSLSAYSQERWLEKQLISLSDSNPDTKVNFSDCYSFDVKAPVKFTMLSRIVSKVETKEYVFNFDVENFGSVYGSDVVEAMSKSNKNQIIVGKAKKRDTLLLMSEDGSIFECSVSNSKDIKEVGTIESLLGFDINKAPLDMVTTSISGKTLPIAILLGYHIGFGNLLATIKAKYDRYPKGSRLSLDDNQYAIKFSDETLVFDRRDYKTMLVVGSLRKIKDIIKNYSVYQLDLKEVYGSILLDMGITARFTRDLDLMRDMWVDPITEDVLKQMGEPTDFIELLFRAVELLVTDEHDLGRDAAGFRHRGYERIAGFMYKEMYNGIRAQNNKPSKANAKVEINPLSVWMTILQDQSTAPVEDSNPIHNIKEGEVIVYRGAGGRDARTLNSESRKYHENSIGIISDNTSDNGDAGTVLYFTANPKINTLLGTTSITDKKDWKNLEPSEVLGTTTLLAPFIEFDDPKRKNFNSIQSSRTTNCAGLGLLPVRSGYEKVIPFRVSPLYAVMAKETATVTKLTKNTISVKYSSGEEANYPIGKKFGKWQGKMVPHDIVTRWKQGDKIPEGADITYNELFFQYDWVAGNISFKTGLLGRVAFVETADTLEDGCAISKRLSDKLTTKLIYSRDILVEFDQEVRGFIKVGDEVEYDTVLCTLLGTLSTASNDKLFTGDSKEILDDISSINPKAEHKGTIVDVETVYCGDPEDMTPSLRSIVDKSDRERGNKSRELGKPRQDGSVNPGFRVDSKVVSTNSCIIRVKIEATQGMGNGSKIVNGHQMKSVTGRVWEEPQVTESGLEIDQFFGYESLQNRVVESPELLGTTCNLLYAATKAAIKAYRGE